MEILRAAVSVVGAGQIGLGLYWYCKHKPDKQSYTTQVLATMAGMGLLALIAPLSGWATVIGLAAQAMSVICGAVVIRDHRIDQAEEQHRAECRQMADEMRWKH